jgi:quercetin dioxygenase-like cupin family protein
MVRLYRASDAEELARTGYSAKYLADIKFRTKVDDSGFILVTIPTGTRTAPHSHSVLEEVFVALSSLEIIVNDNSFQLNEGDIVIAEPGESHSFSASSTSKGKILAIKFPNLKHDKIEPVQS